MSYTSIQFKQNTLTAALLVAGVTLVVWAIFNAFVEAYPPYVSAYQTTVPTTASTVSELGYPYRVQP